MVQTAGQAGRSYHKNKFLRSLLRRKQGSTRRKNLACTCTDRGQKSDTSPALSPGFPFTIRFQLPAPSGLNFPADRSTKTVKTDHQKPSGDQHAGRAKSGQKKFMAAVKSGYKSFIQVGESNTVIRSRFSSQCFVQVGRSTTFKPEDVQQKHVFPFALFVTLRTPRRPTDPRDD